MGSGCPADQAFPGCVLPDTGERAAVPHFEIQVRRGPRRPPGTGKRICTSRGFALCIRILQRVVHGLQCPRGAEGQSYGKEMGGHAEFVLRVLDPAALSPMYICA